MNIEYYSPDNFFVKNTAYISYKSEFDNLLSLFNESEVAKGAISGLKIFTAEQKACSLIFLKSQHLVISILKLCNKGIAENGGILLRSLFENYIQAKFIIKSNSGEKFLDYRIAAYKRYFDLYEKNNPDSMLITPEYLEFKKKLVQKFEPIKDEYVKSDGQIRERWSKLGIKGMSKEINEMISYDYMMSIYSAYVHCDITGMTQYIMKDSESITFDNSPTPDKVDEVLTLSSEYFGRIVTEWICIFNVEVPSSFKRFLKSRPASNNSEIE